VTERKPVGTSWESWIDRQIREAAERGDFDDLPGKGKPIPGLDKPYDEMWWVAQKLKREGLSLLPPSLQLRREVEIVQERIAAARTEADVERLVREINEKIVKVNAMTFDGPPSNVGPLDLTTTVKRWRAATSEASTSDQPPTVESAGRAEQLAPRRRWWQRRVRRPGPQTTD
jgi:hypothetical protein